MTAASDPAWPKDAPGAQFLHAREAAVIPLAQNGGPLPRKLLILHIEAANPRAHYG